MAEVSEEVCRERHRTMDERFERDKERLERQEDKTDKLVELSAQMGEIIKAHNDKLDNHEHRLGDLESKPAKRWDIIVSAALQWIVVAVLAAVVILKK